MPQNLVERSRISMLPRSVFPLAAIVAITLNVILASTLMEKIWPALIFWVCSGSYFWNNYWNGSFNISILGLLLFWRCDCCTCEGLFLTANDKLRLTGSNKDDNSGEIYKDGYIDTVLIARWHDPWFDKDSSQDDYVEEM